VDSKDPFTDPALVGRYAEDTGRKVPGFADLHRMAMLLLAEHAGEQAEILVLGAGGGLELKALATAQPQWRFVGVDPSAPMLELAGRVVGDLGLRMHLLQGYVDSAPPGPFDGATCLLTLHFLGPEERLRTLREIHKRLKPGAPLVVAHHSAPKPGEPALWLSRSVAFANYGSVDFRRAADSAAAMAARLPVQPVETDESLLREAGFSNVALFYAAFSFRGWVAAA
jgi:tRNA (cmo5U34)-methyltransferase